MLTLKDERLVADEEPFDNGVEVLSSEAIFLDSPEAIVLTELDGRILKVNPAFERMFQYADSDVAGRSTRGLYAEPEAFDLACIACEREQKTGQPLRFHTNLRRSDDSTFPARAAVTRILDDSHATQGYVSIFLDLTAHETQIADHALIIDRLTADCANLQALYEKTPAIMHSIDADGRLAQVSDTWLERFGYRREEVLGRRSIEFLDTKSRARAAKVFKDFWVKGSCHRIPYTFLTKTGQPVEVELSAIAQDLTEGKRTLAILEDVTERNSAQSQLEERNAQLADFARITAHDLQAPLRHITFFSRLLRQDIGSGAIGELAEKAEAIEESAAHLSGMIKGLLEFSVAAEDTLDLRLVEVETLVKRMLRRLEDRIKDTGAEVTVDTLPSLMCDPILIERVFDNLFSNALKYVSPDVAPRIKIQARLLAHEWCITVSDNGIGVPEAFAKRIFKPLKRLHSQDSQYPGNGIGLALCAKIIEAHKGRIWVESIPAGGCRFCFTLPAYLPSGERDE